MKYFPVYLLACLLVLCVAAVVVHISTSGSAFGLLGVCIAAVWLPGYAFDADFERMLRLSGKK